MPDDPNQKLVHDLATASLREQRARRRWSVFFRLLFFGYIIGVTVLYYAGPRSGGSVGLGGDAAHYAAAIQINGAITADGANSAAAVNSLLRSAFEDEYAKGIILEINSPGGSAVESNRIYNEIRRLREKHPGKKVIAVAGDFCASGGYFIAAAADEIYADPASIIGSIGVIFSGFGFVETLEKLGIERRVQTAGGSKNLLDPFQPQRAEDTAVITGILDDVHAVFKQAVRDGRGERLADDARIFSGTLFSGSDSIALGLADGFNDSGGVARDIIGVEDILYYGKQEWWDNVFNRFSELLAPAGGVMAVAPAR